MCFAIHVIPCHLGIVVAVIFVVVVVVLSSFLYFSLSSLESTCLWLSMFLVNKKRKEKNDGKFNGHLLRKHLWRWPDTRTKQKWCEKKKRKEVIRKQTHWKMNRSRDICRFDISLFLVFFSSKLLIHRNRIFFFSRLKNIVRLMQCAREWMSWWETVCACVYVVHVLMHATKNSLASPFRPLRREWHFDRSTSVEFCLIYFELTNYDLIWLSFGLCMYSRILFGFFVSFLY